MVDYSLLQQNATTTSRTSRCAGYWPNSASAVGFEINKHDPMQTASFCKGFGN